VETDDKFACCVLGQGTLEDVSNFDWLAW